MSIRFAAIGLDHGHIHGQVAALAAAGGVLAGYATESDALAEEFEAKHEGAVRRDAADLLEDGEVALVTSAAIPSLRAGLAVRAMEAGKDVMLDKPGAVSREGLALMREAHERTGRRVLVHYSELESNAASLTALKLVREGAIGRLVHYSGTGPHRLDQGVPRPDWFFDRDRAGGILVDIASHQIAQFLAFAGATTGRITAARVACTGSREGFQDVGDMLMECDGPDGPVHGYGRVDWYTPKGLPTWGDGRILLTGTEGTIELRKYVDPAGDGLGAHLILTDGEGPRRIECSESSRFAARMLEGARTGGETAMDQALAFHLMELGLDAQAMAELGAEGQA